MYRSTKQQWSSRRNFAIGRVAGLLANAKNLKQADSQEFMLTIDEYCALLDTISALSRLSGLMTPMTYDEFHTEKES